MSYYFKFPSLAYVLALIILLSLTGIVLEPLLIVGVLQTYRAGFIRAWFWLTGFTIVSSLTLAASFLMHNFGSLAPGENWFENALCSLANIVFFFVPDHFLGPRLEPILRAMLIIVHFLLPILHGLSFYVVYSFYKCRHRYLHNQQNKSTGAEHGYVPPSAPDSNGGRRSVTPQIPDQVIPYKPRMCQNCAHKTLMHNKSNGVYNNRGCQEPLIEEQPIETTC